MAFQKTIFLAIVLVAVVVVAAPTPSPGKPEAEKAKLSSAAVNDLLMGPGPIDFDTMTKILEDQYEACQKDKTNHGAFGPLVQIMKFRLAMIINACKAEPGPFGVGHRMADMVIDYLHKEERNLHMLEYLEECKRRHQN